MGLLTVLEATECGFHNMSLLISFVNLNEKFQAWRSAGPPKSPSGNELINSLYLPPTALNVCVFVAIVSQKTHLAAQVFDMPIFGQ